MHAEVPALNHNRPDAPAELDPVLRRMMAKRPEDRYQTPGELVPVLEPMVAGSQTEQMVPVGLPVTARADWPTRVLPSSSASPAVGVQAARRHTRRWLVVAVAAAALLILLALSLRWSSKEQMSPTESAGPVKQFKNSLGMELVLVPKGSSL